MRSGNLIWPVALICVAVALLASQGLAGVQGLRFSHRLHVEDAEMACIDCHPGAEQVSPGTETLMPSKAVCADCHDVEDPSTCSQCHASDDNSLGRDAMLAGDVFSHGKHGDLECAACHAGIESAQSSEETRRPEVTLCGDCHLEKRLAPLRHKRAGWEFGHAHEAGIDPQSCDLCHVERERCDACHRGNNLTADSPHPLSFLYSHGPDARVETSRCESCHRQRIDCTECHATLGVQPLSHDLSGWQRGAHATEARKHLDQCMTCHPESEAETTCGACH